MLAGLMALNAFAIDAMIPALPDIGRSLHVTHENDRQLVVVAYFFGFGFGQLFWGPLADRFGRKPILAAGVALYAGFAALCAVAGSFDLLLAGRLAGSRAAPGWERPAAARASRRNRSRKVPSSASSPRRTLTATGRVRVSSTARYTAPMPPVAIRSPSR